MTAFVSLPEVKARLNIDFDDKDTVISMTIEAASGAVVDFLKDRATGWLDESGAVIDEAAIPAQVKLATIILCGLYLDDTKHEVFGDCRLPAQVRALIAPLRLPTVA